MSAAAGRAASWAQRAILAKIATVTLSDVSEAMDAMLGRFAKRMRMRVCVCVCEARAEWDFWFNLKFEKSGFLWPVAVSAPVSPSFVLVFATMGCAVVCLHHISLQICHVALTRKSVV